MLWNTSFKPPTLAEGIGRHLGGCVDGIHVLHPQSRDGGNDADLASATLPHAIHERQHGIPTSVHISLVNAVNELLRQQSLQ